ncbi:hypothetical protein DM01DRAFT_1063505 [Hesseltinella vesiculosa]|uniref:Uncharacterized protein n=1 Tax=Hesseltinella vesiculosa TaxID=101127 RepID=A0A1X2GEC5_9FUNG|nr:hypothetical protein DM01DRAFT_1063505 [Hesseltinella vesiculosa]
MDGLQAVVDFNRRVLICSHLFILDYFNSCLTNGLDIPLVYLDYRFVNGVFQLVIGRSWLNASLITQEVCQHIEESFPAFLIQHPSIHCPLVPSTMLGKRPPYWIFQDFNFYGPARMPPAWRIMSSRFTTKPTSATCTLALLVPSQNLIAFKLEPLRISCLTRVHKTKTLNQFGRRSMLKILSTMLWWMPRSTLL